MKSLKTLIRVEQKAIDQLRRAIVTLENQRDGLIAEIERMNDELHAELNAADELMDLRGFFGDFSDAIKKRQRLVATRVVNVEQQIQQFMLQVNEHFATLKKYEIAHERYLEREKKERDRKEQMQMDEAGLRSFLYGGDE